MQLLRQHNKSSAGSTIYSRYMHKSDLSAISGKVDAKVYAGAQCFRTKEKTINYESEALRFSSV